MAEEKQTRLIKGNTYKGTNNFFVLGDLMGVDMHFRKIYECVFYETFSRVLQIESEILNGNVTDPMYSVEKYYQDTDGNIKNKDGEYNKFLVSEFRRFLYKDMVDKLTKPRHEMYKYYGNLGYKLCKRWQTKENFFIDFPNIEGYDEMMTTDYPLSLVDYRVVLKTLPNGADDPSIKEFNVNTCKFELLPDRHVFCVFNKKLDISDLFPELEPYFNGEPPYTVPYNIWKRYYKY